MNSPDRQVSPCPAELDRKSAAYRQAVRAALADAPPVAPDVHARLRAILARPAADSTELLEQDASPNQLTGVIRDHDAGEGQLWG